MEGILVKVYIMLKGIPAILSPEILKTLMEMGRGDEILLAFSD